MARCPRTLPTTSTASLPVLARRFRADPHEIGRFEGIGPDLWKSGAAATRASVGSEPVTPEDCGRDCGAASRTGREHLQGSSPPDERQPIGLVGFAEGFGVKGGVIMDRRGGGERPGVALQYWTTRRLP